MGQRARFPGIPKTRSPAAQNSGAARAIDQKNPSEKFRRFDPDLVHRRTRSLAGRRWPPIMRCGADQNGTEKFQLAQKEGKMVNYQRKKDRELNGNPELIGESAVILDGAYPHPWRRMTRTEHANP